MAVFKCKMCGGALEINNNETVVTCEYCGTQQTLPRLDDERRANLYDRANHFRRNNEFDKAMGIYEQILNEDNSDAEAYWSLVLCRYGIEYVEDPATRKHMPTINRAQFTSVFDDDNYKSALQYADGYQRTLYEEEARAINEIQKNILAISQKEEPFDVFICYKETDNNGRRTQDSVLANDLYHQLTQEGFKVFFSRITLEDKLGTAYEPYIFAALNSAKVMVVLGTKAEYFNAVWVRNEWSRYLALIKQGKKKLLIPAYRDMNPYDLPEEFSHLQAQDMSKLGFMQDLIRGIKKIVQADAPEAVVVKETVVTRESANAAPLLKRVLLFLEDGDWNSADEYCEKVLDIDPENASAYLGKLMVELRVKKQEDLKNQAEPFDNRSNFQKAVRFADGELKATLNAYIEYINARNENAHLEGIYKRAKKTMSAANTESTYKEAARMFETISGYLDSSALIAECCRKAEDARKDTILADGKKMMAKGDFFAYKSAIKLFEPISGYKDAIKTFESISGWKDADEMVYYCQRKIEEINAEEERRAERNKRIAIISSAIICLIVLVVYICNQVNNSKEYKAAVALMEEGKYKEAQYAFTELGGYKDSEARILDCRYNDAVVLMDAENIVEAYEALIALSGYKDSVEKANSIYNQYKIEKIKIAKVGDCVLFGSYEQDNNIGNGKEEIEWLVLEVEDSRVLVISKYALDWKQYNTESVDVTWESCTLRKWLNSYFFDSAFTYNEKAMIPTVRVVTARNPACSTNPGNATQDKVFLLSIEEANRYFTSADERQCKSADDAYAGMSDDNSDLNCWWWLRSPGVQQDFAALVDSDGCICTGDYDSDDFTTTNLIIMSIIDSFSVSDENYVRPALWIDLSE